MNDFLGVLIGAVLAAAIGVVSNWITKPLWAREHPSRLYVLLVLFVVCGAAIGFFVSDATTEPFGQQHTGPDVAVPTNDVLFRDNFENPGRGWEVGQGPHGVEQYVSGTYGIKANPGFAVWSPAPAVRPAARIKLTANARLASGQGGWGVWCRGTDAGERYEFSVTHAGVAYIKTPGEKGTGPVTVPGYDAYQDTRLVAECSDAANGAGVDLALTVNGTTIRYRDPGPLLTPGKVGVHAFSFGDVKGEPSDVRFSYFEVSRLP